MSSGKESFTMDRIRLPLKFNLRIPLKVLDSVLLNSRSWMPFLLRSRSSNTVIGCNASTGIFFNKLLCKFNLFTWCKDLKSKGFKVAILLKDKSRSSKASSFVNRSGVISESSFCAKDSFFRLETSLKGSGQYVLIALLLNRRVSTWEFGGNLEYEINQVYYYLLNKKFSSF